MPSIKASLFIVVFENQLWKSLQLSLIEFIIIYACERNWRRTGIFLVHFILHIQICRYNKKIFRLSINWLYVMIRKYDLEVEISTRFSTRVSSYFDSIMTFQKWTILCPSVWIVNKRQVLNTNVMKHCDDSLIKSLPFSNILFVQLMHN